MKNPIKRIITDDGIELQGALYKNDEKSDTVLAHVHGMAGNFYENKFIDEIIINLLNSNISFSPFNNRGNGHISTFFQRSKDKINYPIIGNAFEKFEDCIIDIKAHIDYLESVGYKKIHIMGHSLGAPKVAYYLAKAQDERVSSVIFLAPADMLGLAKNDLKEYNKLIKLAENMFNNGKGNMLMEEFYDESYPLSSNTFLNLFSENSQTKIFNFHKENDDYKILNKIKIPMLTITGDNDYILLKSAEETMKCITDNYKHEVKCETKIIPKANHIFTDCEEVLAKTLVDWINNN